MNIQPRNDFVLIKRDPQPQMAGLIALPEAQQDKSIIGTVVAIGDGKWIEGVNGNRVRRPLEVKPGDRVYFNSKWNDLATDHYTTTSREEARTNAERERLHLVQESDIFLVIT